MTTYWDTKKKTDQLVKSFEKTKVKHRKLHWQEQDEFVRRGSKDKDKNYDNTIN
jgi:hypothetical protein